MSDALAAAAEVEGWLSDDQAGRLWERAAAVAPGGTIVEIGSYRGRSAIVLATAAREGVEVVAIDPHAGNDRGPREIHGTSAQGEADHRAFLDNLARAGVDGRVRHVRAPSQDALDAVAGAVDLLYVDGAHRYGSARADLARWGARVAPGGTMLVHDAFSAVGVTLALATLTFRSAGWRYHGRSRSLAEYRREPLDAAARRRNLRRQLAELPWFARNLALKVALTARLRSGEWPY
ncbi:MAG TPA: class I SAM-dependent methyltransferase [Solirubrobacteraceae bacterium]|nr:class I SAM-dependent methyltransferase [Solirubrobacteraceae bacterium]